MPVFILRLKAPRPRLRANAHPRRMEGHGPPRRKLAAYLERGDTVAFGPVLTANFEMARMTDAGTVCPRA